jgi:hypothetical protein
VLNHLNRYLDKHILPWPVRFVTFRLVILATILLLIPLIFFADNQILVLGINSYLNTMGMVVSSIVLLYASISEREQRQIAELQEKRAQEDHEHLTEMHALLQETLAREREQIEDLKEMVARGQGQAYQRLAPVPVQDLEQLHARGANRFAADDSDERVEQSLKTEK